MSICQMTLSFICGEFLSVLISVCGWTTHPSIPRPTAKLSEQEAQLRRETACQLRMST